MQLELYQADVCSHADTGTRTDTHENAGLQGFYHMTVGHSCTMDAHVFSAVNRSHLATGA